MLNNEEVRALFQDIVALVEAAANFSNGVEYSGQDEGDVVGWSMWRDYMDKAAELGLIQPPQPKFTEEESAELLNSPLLF